MNWQSFRQLKGQSVQDYTQEFRRRALLLGIDLHSQDTFLKYIGGLHNYLNITVGYSLSFRDLPMHHNNIN